MSPAPVKHSDFPALATAGRELTSAGIAWTIEVDVQYVWIEATVLGETRKSRYLLRSHKPNRKQIAGIVEWAEGLARVVANTAPPAPEPAAEAPAESEIAPASPLSIPVVIVGEEPRVLDTDLAAALGMARDRDIRPMIRDNVAELESFGILRAAAANSDGGRGRPGTAYHLNEEQALLICMLSRTERAKQVRAEVIRVFTAWRRGQLGDRTAQAITEARQTERNAIIGAPIGFMRDTLLPVVQRCERDMVKLDERIDKMAGWLKDRADATYERDRRMLATLTDATAALEKIATAGLSTALEFQAAGFMNIHLVYRASGTPAVFRRRALLSRMISASLDSHCKRCGYTARSAEIGNGRWLTYWPRAAVIEWLAETGREMIARHLNSNPSIMRVV